MKHSRVILSIVVGILVCFLLIPIFRNYLIILILGIFTALKIADPEQRKMGVLMGTIIGSISSISIINKTIFSMYDPKIYSFYIMVLSTISALVFSGAIGAGLGAIQFSIYQHLKNGKINL